MITVYSPRIQNLGDFSHCFPTLSGFYKAYGKFSFGICPRMKRFKGIIELLMYQGMFTDVFFIDEIHRLNIAVEEMLYSAMEDNTVDILIGEGATARSVKINIPPFVQWTGQHSSKVRIGVRFPHGGPIYGPLA